MAAIPPVSPCANHNVVRGESKTWLQGWFKGLLCLVKAWSVAKARYCSVMVGSSELADAVLSECVAVSLRNVAMFEVDYTTQSQDMV
jgi:hypothetical protein